MGLATIRECLYGASEDSEMSLKECCKYIAEWMLDSDDEFMTEAMSNINSILGYEVKESTELANTLFEGAQAVQESLKLINFKIDSIDALKKAIDLVDITPKTSIWLSGIVAFVCFLYAAVTVGLGALGTGAAMVLYKTSAYLGLIGLAGLALTTGAVYFGMDALEYIVTKCYNKITGAKELPPSEVDKSVDKIIDSLVTLEQKLKKAKRLEDVRRLHALKDDIFKRWGIYQKQQEEAARRGGRDGAILGAVVGHTGAKMINKFL